MSSCLSVSVHVFLLSGFPPCTHPAYPPGASVRSASDTAAATPASSSAAPPPAPAAADCCCAAPLLPPSIVPPVPPPTGRVECGYPAPAAVAPAPAPPPRVTTLAPAFAFAFAPAAATRPRRPHCCLAALGGPWALPGGWVASGSPSGSGSSMTSDPGSTHARARSAAGERRRGKERDINEQTTRARRGSSLRHPQTQRVRAGGFAHAKRKRAQQRVPAGYRVKAKCEAQWKRQNMFAAREGWLGRLGSSVG